MVQIWYVLVQKLIATNPLDRNVVALAGHTVYRPKYVRATRRVSSKCQRATEEVTRCAQNFCPQTSVQHVLEEGWGGGHIFVISANRTIRFNCQ